MKRVRNRSCKAGQNSPFALDPDVRRDERGEGCVLLGPLVLRSLDLRLLRALFELRQTSPGERGREAASRSEAGWFGL